MQAKTVVERFWSYVKKGEQNECWNWVNRTKWQRYGRLRNGKKKVYVHRLSYEIHIGPIPEGMEVCHTCDNGYCVNPNHLFLGSHKNNMEDMVSKGRQGRAFGNKNGTHTHPERVARGDKQGLRLHPEKAARGDRNGARLHPETRPRGEKCKGAKLTTEQVIFIRKEKENGVMQKDLALRFGVCEMTISRIMTKKNWKEVS
jgi:hypothetical protein